MVLDPHLFNGSRHYYYYIGKKDALLITDKAHGISNYLEGHDKEIPCLLIYSSFRITLHEDQEK